MKAFLVIMCCMAFLTAVEPDERGYIVKVGDESPNFKLQLIDGRTISKTDLKGKVTVLQFTASWCSVCRREMPHLEKDVWLKYKDEEFIMIGVDRDEPLDVVKAFKKDMQVTYPMALDPGADIFSLFAVREAGVNRNVVLDKTGKIVFLTRLFEEEEHKAMISKIHELLND